MVDDEEWSEDKREADAARFLNNKIKRCKICHNELTYIEKFYFTERLCTTCKDKHSSEVAAKDENSAKVQFQPFAIPPDLEDKGQENRTPLEQMLFSKYPEWQLYKERAEKKWRDENTEGRAHYTESSKTSFAGGGVPDERIFELLSQYDQAENIDITESELVTLLWEILYHRKINTVF